MESEFFLGELDVIIHIAQALCSRRLNPINSVGCKSLDEACDKENVRSDCGEYHSLGPARGRS